MRDGQRRRGRDDLDDEEEVTFKVPKAKKRRIEKEAPEEEEEEEVEFEEPRRSPNGYILPDPLPAGLIVTDLRKRRWKIGKSVGLGGFGEVYSAAALNGSGKCSKKEEYVIKVEPHTNGPLFVEINFYVRATQAEEIEAFKASHGLDHLGVPSFQASGSFEFRRKKLRFLVLPKYGTDLQTVLDSASHSRLSLETASSIALQIVDSYEYLHSQGFVHKDVKGSNLLFDKGDRIFLVDYGLTSKFRHLGIHKPYQEDARSAHEGTLEYASRDAHLGCVSRRGDIEVLLYNLVDWLGGKLPWDLDTPLKPPAIHQIKIQAFQQPKTFLNKAFDGKTYPDFLEALMDSIDSLPFEDAPDYNYLRGLFRPNCPKSTLSNLLSGSSGDVVGKQEEVVLRLELCSDSGHDKRRPDRRRQQVKKKKGSPIMVTACPGNTEPWTPQRMALFSHQREAIIKEKCEESLKNPTPPMLIQMAKMKARDKHTTRRKGVGKRRIQDRKGSLEGSTTVTRSRFNSRVEAKGASKSPLKASDATAVQQNGGNKKKASPNHNNTKSPNEKRSSLRQHLVAMVGPRISNLVNSIFPFQQQ